MSRSRSAYGDMPGLPGESRLRSSSVFCMAPWTQLHVLPTGEVFPCCMAAEPRDAIGNLRKGDSLSSSWNSPAMRQLRSRMLRDEPSPSCHLCYKGESVGQGSLRTAENHRMAHHYGVVRQTQPDGRLYQFAVPTLDIRFSNVCNLRCRICSAKLSSAWHGDAVRLGWADPARPAVLTATDDPASLLDQVLQLLPGVERMHFAGGEPLMSEEHFVILERLINSGRRDVHLTYNTNLSKLRFRQWDVVEFWREFPRIYLQASLDGMGERGEYMRKGQRWDDAVANRRRIMAECPHVEFVVHATVSVLNALHLPDFYRAWLGDGLIGPGGMRLNILHGPPHYNVRAFPPRLKDRVEASYREFLTWLTTLGPAATGPSRDFEAVIRHMRAEDWNMTEEFRQRTMELDVLRGESLAQTFPELADWVTESADDSRLRLARTRARLGMHVDSTRDPDGLPGDLDRTRISSSDGSHIPEEARALRTRLALECDDSSAPRPDIRGQPAGGPDMPAEEMLGAAELYLRARKQRLSGDAEGALQSLALAVARAPEEAEAWLTQRLIDQALGRSWSLDPERVGAPDAFDSPTLLHYLRGLARQFTGDAQGAAADLSRVAGLELLVRAANEAQRRASR